MDDKELFYENFRICKISLEDDAIIEFLENETGLKLDKKNKREKALLSLLFSYLKEENFDTPNLFIQQHNISKYRDKWNSLNIIKGYSKVSEEIEKSVDDILTHYDAIILNKDCTRIKQQDFAFSHNKMDLLRFSAKLLSLREGVNWISFCSMVVEVVACRATSTFTAPDRNVLVIRSISGAMVAE